MPSLAGLIAVVATLSACPIDAATYKWVDEKGVIHYSDSLPPEAVDRGSVQLNKQGVPIKKTDPAPTAEQRKAMLEEAEREKAQAKDRELADRRDRALIDSYTSEDEIELAKTRALATVDSQLQSAQAYSTQLTKRREILAAAKKSAAGEKGMTDAQERELEGINAELAKQDALIQQKKKEIEAITAKYDGDRKRWRELKSQAEAAAAAAAAAAARTSGPPATAPGPPQKSSSRPASNSTSASAGGSK